MNADWDQYKAAAEEALNEGDYACAEIMWQAAYRQAQEFNKLDPRWAITLEGLAEALWHQQKFDEAEKYATETLEFFTATRGPNHLDVGVTANNLAMLYKMQGKYAEAEPLYRRAIDILKVAIGSDHPEFQNILAHFAEVLRQTGRADEATRLTTEEMKVTSNRLVKSGQYQALELEPDEKLTEEPPLPDETQPTLAPPDMTWNQYRLAAEDAMAKGDFIMAEANWRQAYRKTAEFPPYDRRWCTTVESLSESLWKQGKYAEAEPLCRKTLQAYQNVLGSEHPDVAVIATNLAMLCHAQGKYEEAERLYDKAFPIRAKALGPQHPAVTNMLSNYANLLRIMGRIREAKELQDTAGDPLAARWVKTGQFETLVVAAGEQLRQS